MKKAITRILLTLATANPLFAYEVMVGNDADICSNAQKLPYDITCPDEWLPALEEAFVIASPAGYPGCENRVCLKLDSELDRYYMYTVSEARKASFLATKVDASSRTEIPRAIVTQGDRFLEGDPALYVDGATVYLTGVVANNATQDWDPVIEIYESPMVPANGEDFDFTHKQTYDPGAVDPRFDYYAVGGQIAIKEGSQYVLTFAGYRVPEGKPKSWAGDNGVEIQTIFYQMASKDINGDFVWEGYPRMINAYVDNINVGNNLGTAHTVMSGPRTHQSWSAPPGGQINGIHLNGDVFEIDGERWFYWVWFEGGNHIASARISDTFTFADPSPTKQIWHTPLNIVQNSNPVTGEQGVNENATTFRRNGNYYFIFTHGHVVGNYSMSYFMSDSFETIARGVGSEYVLFESYPDLGVDSPLHTPGRREIGGSGRAITKTNGDMFMFYGIGTFDRGGNYQGRKIHYSKLSFNSDDTIVPLKEEPVMQLDPHRIPSSIQLSWTDRSDYEYHLNALVAGQLLVEHPSNPATFGSGYLQLHAGYLGNSTSWNLTQIEFVSTTFPGQNEMIDIDEIGNLDGFRLSYAYQGNWGSQSAVTVGYNHRTSQHIHFDVSVAEGIHLSWNNLGNYECHLNVIQNGSEVVNIPGYGNGYCQLTAADLGFGSYVDLQGFYFTPVEGGASIWLTIDDLPGGYQYGFQISYAYQGNWHIGSLRGAASIPWNGTMSQHIPIADPDMNDPLFSEGDAANLFIGQSDGFTAFDYNGTTYTMAGGCGMPPGVVDIAPVAGGVHVVSDSGLTYFSYDAATGAFAENGHWNFVGATGVAVAPDGGIYTSSTGGLGRWSYANGAYISDAWHGGSNGRDVAVDPNGYIHVAQADGLSGWAYSEGSGLTLAAWEPGWSGNTCLAIDSGGVIHLGKGDGFGDLIFTGSSYAWGGHWAGTASGINTIVIDEATGRIWAGQGDGVQVVDASSYALIAYGGLGSIDAVCVDSAGNVHLGKFDGMMSVDIVGNSVIWNGTSWAFISAGVNAIAGFEPLGTYEDWVEKGYGLVGADALRDADPDGDGLDNRLEYALGGNPNLDDIETVVPAFNLEGEVIEYVYNRRLDAAARSLIYGLKETDDLQAPWIAVRNAYEIGSGVIDSYYESVTNQIPTTGSQGFFQLEVEEN